MPGIVINLLACALPTAQAAMSEASLYWPSTPMLNRFILNPMATATPEM